MIVLGIHKDPWHNTAAALIRDIGDGMPRMAYIAEERLDRVKDSSAFPTRAVEACMRELGVESYGQIDHVVMDYIRDGSDWRRDHFRRPCREGVFLADIARERVHVVNHHLLHACATFYSSPFDEAAVLIVDGRGSDQETQSLFHATGTRIELVEATRHIGVGLLYAAVTQAIGFAKLEEGKTMGLAPYGAHLERHVFDFQGRFEGITTDYSRFCVADSYEIALPHAPITCFDDKARGAYEVQQECERAMLHLARHAAKATGASRLCLSGGVALNSVANNRVRTAGVFEDVFINPAASDTGIALGAALYGYHNIAGRPRDYRSISPFLGPDYSDAQMSAAIARYTGFTAVHDRSFERATDLLAHGHIVACVQGRSEMGPRALGNRSILMSPMGLDNKDRLNARVKRREPFRPFAPATLAERAAEFFEIDRESPYMLFICDVRPDQRHRLPAITHVDGTARLQTLTPERNGRFYDLVRTFGERTGVPVLLNTSFNVAGEPIVETPDDAIRCFLGTDIDALLLGDHLLLKPGREA
jgi:carbamoyltransferase